MEILPDMPSPILLNNGDVLVPVDGEADDGSQMLRLEPGEKDYQFWLARTSGSVSGAKVCPQCAEEVKLAAHACRFCGHEFDGQEPVDASEPVAQPQTTSGAAIASFITSLLGLWIAGIPLGIHAEREIDRSNGRLTGRGFAIAGILLGIIGIFGTVILVVVLVQAAGPQT